MSLLVLNAGSSTLKFALFDGGVTSETCSGMVDWQGQQHEATLTIRSADNHHRSARLRLADYGDAVAWILRTLADSGYADPIQAIGHRVVHGGTEFRDAILIDDQVRDAMRKISKLAPLHHPPVLTTFKATKTALPDIPQVAVFDTSYFADLPERAVVYPAPYQWYEQFGIRRFGFHGISHEYCATRATELLDRQHDAALRLVVCHLGNGCSATSVLGGKPVMNTMGFTPLEGLMMGTRSGSIDPGIMIYLMQEQGFTAEQLDEALNRQAGLLGVSGFSSDYRALEQSAANGDSHSQLAIELFTDRVRSAIGSLAVTMGGVDGLVFTAGIGENSASLRRTVCRGLECLGLCLDEAANEACRTDGDIASSESRGRILIVRTREEQMVARHTKRLLARQ